MTLSQVWSWLCEVTYIMAHYTQALFSFFLPSTLMQVNFQPLLRPLFALFAHCQHNHNHLSTTLSSIMETPTTLRMILIPYLLELLDNLTLCYISLHILSCLTISFCYNILFVNNRGKRNKKKPALANNLPSCQKE